MSQQIMPAWAGLIVIALFVFVVIAIALRSPTFFSAVKRCFTLAVAISVLSFTIANVFKMPPGPPFKVAWDLFVVSGLSGFLVCVIAYGTKKAISTLREGYSEASPQTTGSCTISSSK